MKNVIRYYYNLNPENITKLEKTYKFLYENQFYTFIDITNDIKNISEIYNISIELNKNGIYTHQFVFNNQNNIETYVNDKIYVLLKSHGEMNSNVTIQDIINFSNITSKINYNSKLKRNNWYNLWINKMDYFEYQISQLGKKYPLLTESFSYFEGIVETGISLLSLEKIDETTFSICHNRISKKNTLFDLYNPLNFIVDVKIRDIVEFIKESVEEEKQMLFVEKYLKSNKLTDLEYKLFFIRFLYPSFYFDTYEKIINKELDESEIIVCIEKIKKYEKLIKSIYDKIKIISTLPDIEWIKKM